MTDSNSSKPGSRPGSVPSPAAPTAARDKTATNDPTTGKAGRVVHDARGNAVWDWIKDTTRVAIDSTSRLLKRLEVPELKMEDTQNEELRLESDRDPGGGYDPYGGSTLNRTPSAGSTRGAPTNSGVARGSGNPPGGRSGAPSDPNRHGSTNAGPSTARGASVGQASSRTPNAWGTAGAASSRSGTSNAGGGYDPYGKGITTRKR